MILIPYEYNGTALSSTDYETQFPRASANLQIQTNPSYIKRAGAVPVFSGKDFQPHVLQLEILCKHDFTDLFENINQLFDTKDETPRQFVCTDNGSTDSMWYVYATAKQVLGGHDGNMVTVSLALDDPIWQSYTQTSQTFSCSDTTDTTSVSVTGNDYSYPIFEITPTTVSSSDYAYSMYVQVLPRSNDPWNNRFLDITGTTDTTFDTAALVGAGKMQADGDDLRVFRDGIEVDRWLNGINTTDTHVIVSCDMPGRRNMTLLTALDSTSTYSEITLQYTTTNKTNISAVPNSGRLIIDSGLNSTDTEEFTYTSRTITESKLAFTVNARSVRGTGGFAHAVGSNVRYLPYDFTIVYGNPLATASVTDDTRKPIVDLTSRNWSLIYSTFYDEAGLRPNIWTKANLTVSDALLSRSNFYTSTDDAGDTDPATALGIATYTYSALGAWKADAVTIAWRGYFPDGIDSVSASGQQNQFNANIPATRCLQSRSITTTATSSWTTLWSLSAESATDYGTWQAWSKSSSDAVLPTGQNYLRFLVLGTQLGSTDVSAKAEINSMTVGLTSYPCINLRTEANNNSLDCVIGNSETGESMTVKYPLGMNETLIIDTDPDFPTAKYKGQLVNGAVSLSSVRAAWLKFQPGTNTITYDSNLATASGITIVIKWRNRMNYF